MSGMALAIPSGSDKSKRSFEFRMCKKVAELTQVVHMLFTRNHEKEIEVEAVKEAYEFEICEIISDAKTRIAKMQQEQENVLKQQTVDVDRIRKLLEGELRSKEREWERRLEESDKHLQEERVECQNLRDLLIRTQLDMENVRRGVTDQKTSLAEEVTRRDRDIERLRKQVQQLEQALKKRDQEKMDLLKETEKDRDNLERQLRHVQGMLEEAQQTRDQLLVRNKQIEADLKALKREFNRKMAEMMNAPKRIGSAFSVGQNEELERLRREIQRYRLELSNRDANFNRMFTDKQPIHLDRSGGSAVSSSSPVVKMHTTSHSAGTVHPGMNGASGGQPGILRKERSLLSGPASGPVICFQEPDPPPLLPSERQRAMSTPSTHLDSRDSRLPSISSSPDIKPRPQDTKSRPLQESKTRQSNNSKLSKPRPLPKEMLFGK